MRHPSIFQTCSIGFMSGEHIDHSIRSIVSASSMIFRKWAACGLALSCWETKEAIGCSIKYEMRPQYLVFILWGHQSITSNDMQIRAFNYVDFTVYHIGILSVFCTIHEQIWGYFEWPSSLCIPKHVGCHTPDWIGTLLKTELGSNNIAPNFDVQQLIFFGPHGDVNGMQTIDLSA